MKKKRTVSLIVIVIISALLALIVSFSVYFFVLQNRINQVFFDEAFVENEEIAESAVDILESKIFEEINTIISIEVAHHNIIGQENEIFVEEYYDIMLSNSDYIKRIEVMNLNKEILYSTNEIENRVGINLSNYYLFEDITKEHELKVGTLIYDTTNNELSLEVAYSGEDVIVSGLISIEFFSLYGTEFKKSFPDKEIMILDDQGKFLYDSNDDQHLIQNFYSDFDELLSSTGSTTYSTFIVNNQESIVNMKLIGINDWRIVIYESTSSALQANKITNNYYATIIIGILTLVVLSFGTVVVYLFKNFKQIINRLQYVAEGDFGEDIEHSSIYEIDVIRTGFNEMKNKIKSSTERLEYLAYHDDLTGLPTKNKAAEDFEKLKQDNDVAVLYIDISRFEVVNDNYGYQFGDETLQSVSKIIVDFVDKLYRVQSDEFLGFIVGGSKEEVFGKVEELSKIVSDGLDIGEITIPISLNIGLARYPKHGTSFVDLLKKAIISSHEAKTLDNINYLCFDDSKSDNYMRLSKIELIVNRALNEDEFKVVYQPIINVKDGTIRGFEALSRWTNPELGVVSPDEFIPILERTGKVSRLDELVLNRTLRLNKFIKDQYGVSLVACVNVSVETIMKDNFTQMVDDALEKFHYDPSFLEIEITESTIIHDFEGITKKMKYLRSKGVKFSEDDFGDAYSSLTYLTRLEIDTIKISKNFLSSILSNVESRVLVQTIVDLSHRLGFFTIVEGIEDEETYNLFKEYGCDFVQGYLFFRPLDEVALLDVIKEKSSSKE